MATTPKGIYYNDDPYDIADVEADMKELAESIDDIITARDERIDDIETDGENLEGRVATNEESILNILSAMNGVLSTLTNNVGRTIDLSLDSSTYVLTASLKNSLNNVLNSVSIDLPLESMVVNGSYDEQTKKIILTLQNGNTIEFSVADLVDGLVSESIFNTSIGNINSAINTLKEVTGTNVTTYDSSETYEESDLVVNNNKIYKCLDETTGNWDSTKWTEVSLLELIQSKSDNALEVQETEEVVIYDEE